MAAFNDTSITPYLSNSSFNKPLLSDCSRIHGSSFKVATIETQLSDKSLDDLSRKKIKGISREVIRGFADRWETNKQSLLHLAVALVGYGNLSRREACLQAAAVHEILSEGTLCGEALSSSYLSRKANNLLRSVELSSQDSNTLYIHFKTHGKEGIRRKSRALLGVGGCGKATLSLRVSRLEGGITFELICAKTGIQNPKANSKALSLRSVKRMSAREFSFLQRLSEVHYVLRAFERTSHVASKSKTNEERHVILMELANEGGVSYEILRRLTPKARWTVFKQLVQSVANLHALNIAHTDINPSNVLLTKLVDPNNTDIFTYEPRLSDFGSATDINDKPNVAEGITDHYGAPELFGENSIMDTVLTIEDWKRMDVYGLTMVAQKAFCGLETIISIDVTGGAVPACFDSPKWEKYAPREIAKILADMRQRDPNIRCTAANALERLEEALSKMD